MNLLDDTLDERRDLERQIAEQLIGLAGCELVDRIARILRTGPSFVHQPRPVCPTVAKLHELVVAKRGSDEFANGYRAAMQQAINLHEGTDS